MNIDIDSDNYIINLKRIAPYLLDRPYKEILNGKIRPSEVRKELKCTTQERIEKLRDPKRRFKMVSKTDSFGRIPEIVIFQNFDRGQTYTFPVMITNQSRVSKNIKVLYDASRHFTITIEDNVKSRIAPGMSINITVTFRPTEKFRDYLNNIRFISDDQSFQIPVFALGPRPMTTTPDKLVLPPTMVRVPSEMSLIVKNISEVPMSFVDRTESPFSVEIKTATIPPGGIFENNIRCLSNKAGLIKGCMKYIFRNQIWTTVDLECEVKIVKLYIDTYSLVFDDVYMGLSASQFLTLRNDSKNSLRFTWKQHDANEENRQLKKMVQLFSDVKDTEETRFKKLEYFNIVNQKQHTDIYQRIYENETSELLSEENDTFSYRSPYFEIIPKVGRILPNSDFEFTVIFTPKEATYYSCNAYLDIEGLENRIKIDLQGGGIGPKVALIVSSIDVNQIYLTDAHQYEIDVTNEGIIPATIKFIEKPSSFGGSIDCVPRSVKLEPNDSKAFLIIFSSKVQGEFLETIDFQIVESGDTLQSLLSGKVICPLLKCIPNELDWRLSVGLVHEKTFTLLNDSKVAISFDIAVHDEIKMKYTLKVSPSTGLVEPRSDVLINVTFSCDLVSEVTTNILVTMWKSSKYVLSIPLRCVCSCPKVVCSPNNIMIKFCFLNCKYRRVVTITNMTDLPGFIEYHSAANDNQTIECQLQETKLFLQAHQSVKLTLTITVTELGPHELPLNFVFGKNINQTVCTINCNGQGPVISYYPDEVNFGKVNVLKRYEQYLTLVNDSPISARVRIYCKNNTSFCIEDSTLELAAEETRKLAISVVFNDPGKIKDIILVEIHQGDILSVKVSAEGIGTSIVCQPELCPELNLGKILTYKLFVQDIKVSNKGSYHNKLLFSKRDNVKNLSDEGESSIPYIFQFEPCLFELDSGEEKDIQIKGICKRMKYVTEQFYCYTITSLSKQINLIKQISIMAEFVDPKISFSKTELHFNLNIIGSEKTGNLSDVIHYQNETGLDLQVNVKVENSFSLEHRGTKSRELVYDLKNMTQNLAGIEYCPTIKERRRYEQHGKLIFEYENHPKSDVINLHGEVMFPTIKLLPNVINFNCVPLGCTKYNIVVIKNISALMTSFKWFWSESLIEVTHLEPQINANSMKNNWHKAPAFSQSWFYTDNDILECDEARQNIEEDEEGSVRIDNDMIYDSKKYKEEMRKILFPLLKTREEEDFLDLPLKTFKSHDITKWLAIEPSEGILEPGEYSLVTIGFNPPPNVELKVSAICKVYGGEEELLNICGKCLGLSYKLDRNSVDFGNKIFCEKCVDQLKLTNNGLCNLPFKVAREEFSTIEWEYFNVTPQTGCLGVNESVDLTVEYFPGIPGYFSKSFLLELGYLEPITVNVCGCAVLSQIFLYVPRTDMNLNDEESYKAISWITPKYLESIHTDTVELIDDEVKDPTNFLKENDWTVISKNEAYPSLMDISMSMERIQAWKHVDANKKILNAHTFLKKVINIPDFTPSPYLVDFGYTVRDVPVCYTVTLYNYGPITTDVKLIEDNKLSLIAHEFKIEFKDAVLSLGKSVQLYVVFSPTLKKWPVLDTEVLDTVSLRVRHGAIITIQLKAVVTLPKVEVQHEIIQFNKVYCGNSLRKTILLSNNGNVVSKWFLTLGPVQKNIRNTGFFIFPMEGELNPGEKSKLNIYFYPFQDGEYKQSFKIKVEKNDVPIQIHLLGEGITPVLTITPGKLEFLPILSYFSTTLSFCIENLSDAVLEFCFPTFNTESDTERRLIEIFLKRKSVKYVFVPYRKPGEKLPNLFEEEYNNLVDRLRKRMRPAKSLSEEGDGSEEEEETNHSEPVSNSLSDDDPLANYSPEKLFSLLKEFIDVDEFEADFNETTMAHVEDYSKNIEIIEPEEKVTDLQLERNLVLIITHGAKNTDYFKAANEIGIDLSYPVYSIDKLIIEALIELTDDCAKQVLSTIDETFSELVSALTGSKEDLLNKEDNPYYKILDKITVILTTKPKKQPKKPGGKDNVSKASSDKSQAKSKPTTSTDCFLNLSPDVLVELLKLKLSRFNYIIIESLTSTFFPKENIALYSVLKAAGPAKYIQFIYFSYTVDDYVRNEVAKQATAEEDKNGPDSVMVKKAEKNKSEEEKKSAKKTSEKGSKSSAKSKKESDVTKKILKTVTKAMKEDFEKSESLQREVLHVSQYWDRKTCTLRKPFLGKGQPSKKEVNAKESVKTLKNSNKRSSEVNLDDIDSAADVGFHIWMIVNSDRNREKDFCNMIRSLIKTYGDLLEATKCVKKYLEPVWVESDTLFSVISNCTNKENTNSSVFTIRDFKVRGSSSLESTKLRSKSVLIDAKSKRRKSSKRTNSSSKSTEQCSLSLKEKDDMEFTTRAALEPGDILKYEIVFSPQKAEKHKHKYYLYTVSNNESYEISCSGTCELPDIDFTPEVMFSKVLENYREKASYDHFVYIKDQQILDFGSVLVNPNSEKYQAYSCFIKLRNPLSTTAEVSVSFSNDTFFSDTSTVIVLPKCEAKLTIITKPTKIGTVTASIYISIKNNPRVRDFTLACTPCKLEFSVSPKLISFEKVPINYTAKRTVKLVNSSPINLRWEFEEYEWANEILDFSETKGFLGLYSTSAITFRFNPREETSFSKKYLYIKVYDVNNKNPEPFCVETILVHGDSVEYIIDFQDLIDYGEIKGGIDHKYDFSVTNKGKSEVALQFQMIDNPLEANNNIRSYFKINPQAITLGSQKTEVIAVSVQPLINFSVKLFQLFAMNMVDNLQSGKLVKSYIIKTNISTFMPSYKICPHSHINFGNVQLASTKRINLQITNKGRFSFSYNLMHYTKDMEGKKKDPGKKKDGDSSKDKKSKEKDVSPNSNKKEKTKSDKSKSSKDNKQSKKEKVKITKLDIRGFSVVSSTGTVEPNETTEISIDFMPRELEKYKEEIILNIPESDEKNKKKILTLEGIGCEPKVNVNEYDKIFIEQFMVKKYGDFVETKNVENYCLFVESEMTLYFNLVCVNFAKTAMIYLKNTGYVDAILTSKLYDDKNVFSISPATTRLEPCSSCSFEISYKPTSLQKARAHLEISSNSQSDNKLMVTLVGDPCLPQVTVLEPLLEHNRGTINFDPTCVGYSTDKTVKLINSGLIKCSVIMEVVDDNETFELLPHESSREYLNLQGKEYENQTKRVLMINLKPNDLVNIQVLFKPTKEQCVDNMLNVHIVNNPFEIVKIALQAYSYNSNVVMEKLKPLKVETKESSSSSITSKSSTGYILDLGYQEMNRLFRTSFTIRNRSQQKIYKFRFFNSTLSFIPEVGHLKPGAWKEVLVVFKTCVPLSKTKAEIACNICEIEYVTPDNQDLSWDDRQKYVQWLPESDVSGNSRDDSLCNEIAEEHSTKSVSKLSCDSTSDIKGKVILERMEPDVIPIADSSEIIPIYFTVFADYNTFICDTKHIDFESIYIKEKKSLTFDVTNTGKGLLNIEWNVIPNEDVVEVNRSPSSTAVTHRSLGEASTLRSVSASELSYKSSLHYQTNVTIEPMIAAVESETSKRFDVVFSPDTPGKYNFTLRSSICSLHPDLDNINISVKAEALSIPFYIEYENGECSNKNLHIEFESIGSGRENIRKVYLYNTSSDHFSFIITPVKSKQFAYFNCQTAEGTVRKNKKILLSFAFIPQLLGQFQEQFNLCIPEKNIAKDVLLSGVCREPKVYFTEDNVTLKPTVPNVKTIKLIYLVNEENVPITFRFNKKTLFGENQSDKIDIFPITGKLGPEGKAEIKICFVTTNSTNNKFHIKCCIEKMKSALFLHITTSCKRVESVVSYTNRKEDISYLHEHMDNIIDFGQINKGKSESVTFTISNTGQTGLFYSWEFNCQSIAHLFYISMDNEKGFLKGDSTTKTVLKIRSIRFGKLNKFKILLKIMYGPTYIIYVNVTCENPLYTFSFNEYDFGCCFPQRKHSKYYQTNLLFKNTDAKDIMLESLFDHNEHMKIDFNVATIHPGESLNIQIDFYPPKEGFYETIIPFQLNDIKHSVKVTGQCVPIKLTLISARDKFIDFDDVLLGSTKKHRLYFCNDTPTKMHVYFDFYDRLKFHEKKIEQLSNTDMKLPEMPVSPIKDTKTKKNANKSKSDEKAKDKDSKESKEKKNKKEKAKNDTDLEVELIKKSEALLKQKEEERKGFLSCFSITPNSFTIPPHGKARMEISFTALKKIKFQEEIYFEIQDHYEPFCMIKGRTISTECTLSEGEVVFSGIVSGNCASRTVKLNNIGDVPESYSWVLEDKGNLFSIEPRQGFVLPKDDAVCKIWFKPVKEICEYRAKAQCIVKGHKEPLVLLLKGTSVQIPEPLNTLTFTCDVRSETVQTIDINNNSFESWDIKLDISNDVFSAIKEMVALPQTDNPVTIRYAPKTMTKSEPHKGDIFIKLPDGSLQLYKLVGNALPPPVENIIENEIRCKTPHYEFLELQNWLSTKQTFDVTTEVLSAVTPKTLYQITGTKSVQLDAKEQKKYKWGVTVINEMAIQFRVTFTNLETKEYVYYDLVLKALPCEPLKTFSFRAKIRSSATQQLILENIVNVPITYSIECSEKSLFFEKLKKLEPYTSVKTDLTYKPTIIEEKSVILTAYCEELGTYLYNIKLKSDSAELTDIIYIKAELGESNTRIILFENQFDQLLEFSIKLDNPEFYITRCPSILPGRSEKIIICFEPSHIGVQESDLYLNSPISGEYIYKLIGEGVIPNPKGPFSVKNNYSTVIEFKNPFYEDKTFNYQIQPDLFSVDLNQEVVKARKSTKIYVKINLKEKPLQNLITGKLLIFCSEHPALYWSYYLQFDE